MPYGPPERIAEMRDEEKQTSSDLNKWLSPGASNVKLIYILYLVGFVIGVSAVVGVVFAHVNRGQSDDWIETHYTYLIRTFWIGLLYFGVGVISGFWYFGSH